jgi:arsenite methyltransferase
MKPRARYGIDAPGSVFGLLAGGLSLLAVTIVNAALGAGLWGVLGPLLGSVIMFFSAGLFLHATLRGKHQVWAELLDELHLRGDERVLDLGCGRGAVLIAVAKRLPRGHVVGVDLWRSVDQSGNSEQVTQRNAELEGVADRVELHTADIAELPFPDADFDLVVTSLAIHNLKPADRRGQALDEAVRALRPGGQLAITDLFHNRDYAERLSDSAEVTAVQQRALGWRFWFGGPWVATTLTTATKLPLPE